MTSDITAEWHCFQCILSVHTQIFMKLSLSGIDHLSFLLAWNIQYKLICNIFIPLDHDNGSLIQNGKFKKKGKQTEINSTITKKEIYLQALHVWKTNYNTKVNYDIYLKFRFIYIVTKHEIVPWFPQNYTGITDKSMLTAKTNVTLFLNCSIQTYWSINLSIVHEHSPSKNQSNQLHDSNTYTMSLQIQLGLPEPKI